MKNHLSVSVTYLKAILYQLESNEHGHAVILEVHADHSQPSFLYKINLNSLFFPPSVCVYKTHNISGCTDNHSVSGALLNERFSQFLVDRLTTMRDPRQYLLNMKQTCCSYMVISDSSEA